jgi:hypothetical protein
MSYSLREDYKGYSLEQVKVHTLRGIKLYYWRIAKDGKCIDTAKTRKNARRKVCGWLCA